MDERLLQAEPPRAGRPRVLRPGRTAPPPESRITRAELQRGSARRAIPAARRQGRLAPVRSQLLPALSTGGAASTDGRDVDGPPGLPLHRPRRVLTGRVPTRHSAPSFADRR